jgi:hypothetical protein
MWRSRFLGENYFRCGSVALENPRGGAPLTSWDRAVLATPRELEACEVRMACEERTLHVGHRDLPCQAVCRIVAFNVGGDGCRCWSCVEEGSRTPIVSKGVLSTCLHT